MSTNYESLKNWIFNSGLIITDSNDNNYGGVYSFYDETNKKYSFLYPEITGYSISACSFLYKLEKNENYLKLAKASSQWLMKIFDEHNGIIQGIDDSNPHRKKLAYSFDTAICAKGLLDLHSITNDSQILQNAEKLINWMLESIEPNGTVMPYMELETKKFSQSNDVWYKQKGCLHIKTCIPLLQLYKISKKENLIQTAEQICDNFKLFQNNDGSFMIHGDTKIINLHTQSYAIEGLLFAYSVTKKQDYLTSCQKALNWCMSNIENDGSIPLWFNFKDKSKAIYPIAQIIRLMILTDKILNSNQYSASINKLVKFIFSLQALTLDNKTNGGFYEEFYKSVFVWKKRSKLNSWGSLFALQALYWYENYDDISFENSILDIY